MEARIQGKTLPSVGCTGLLGIGFYCRRRKKSTFAALPRKHRRNPNHKTKWHQKPVIDFDREAVSRWGAPLEPNWAGFIVIPSMSYWVKWEAQTSDACLAHGISPSGIRPSYPKSDSMEVLSDAKALIEIAWSDPSSTKIPAFSHEEWRHPNTRDENESKKTDPKQSRAEPKTIHAILDVAAEMMRISCPM
jgi:hypothetical protein